MPVQSRHYGTFPGFVDILFSETFAKEQAGVFLLFSAYCSDLGERGIIIPEEACWRV